LRTNILIELKVCVIVIESLRALTIIFNLVSTDETPTDSVNSFFIDHVRPSVIVTFSVVFMIRIFPFILFKVCVIPIELLIERINTLAEASTCVIPSVSETVLNARFILERESVKPTVFATFLKEPFLLFKVCVIPIELEFKRLYPSNLFITDVIPKLLLIARVNAVPPPPVSVRTERVQIAYAIASSFVPLGATGA